MMRTRATPHRAGLPDRTRRDGYTTEPEPEAALGADVANAGILAKSCGKRSASRSPAGDGGRSGAARLAIRTTCLDGDRISDGYPKTARRRAATTLYRSSDRTRPPAGRWRLRWYRRRTRRRRWPQPRPPSCPGRRGGRGRPCATGAAPAGGWDCALARSGTRAGRARGPPRCRQVADQRCGSDGPVHATSPCPARAVRRLSRRAPICECVGEPDVGSAAISSLRPVLGPANRGRPTRHATRREGDDVGVIRPLTFLTAPATAGSCQVPG